MVHLWLDFGEGVRPSGLHDVFQWFDVACVMNLTVRRVAVLTIDVVWFSRDGFTGVWNRVGMRFDCILTEVVGTLGR